MSVSAKKIFLVLTVATLAFTGCTKKPIRPDPSETAMLGRGGPGSGDSLYNQGVDTDPLMLPGTDLEARGGIPGPDGILRGVLEPVFFDFDQSGVKPSERLKLEAAIDYLNQNPQHRLLLEGHCDWRGTAEYNLGLGDRRAGSVRQFLETAGIAASRLETASMGDLDAAENATETQMQQDRRVDLLVLTL